MRVRQIDLPPGTPGCYVRLAVSARKRLDARVGAAPAAVDRQLVDLMTGVSNHATDCCRVGVGRVRPVIAMDTALTRSLQSLILEMIVETRDDADPTDVQFALAFRDFLSEVSPGPAAGGPRGVGHMDLAV